MQIPQTHSKPMLEMSPDRYIHTRGVYRYFILDFALEIATFLRLPRTKRRYTLFQIYLGTYFPRSFAESNLIFDAILHDNLIKSVLVDKDVVRFLDFGCGTGGELMGFLHALENQVSSNLTIKIIGVDGNHNSLRLLEKILSRYNARNRNRVELLVAPCYIESQPDLSDISGFIGSDFDFIITSKAIGEFEKKRRIENNAYEYFVSLFAPLLSETGIMSVLDVTTKDEQSGLFLPQIMNLGINSFLSNNMAEFKSIAPCSGLSSSGSCRHQCFYKEEVYVSHSAKTRDFSKFSVRIISRTELNFDENHIKTIFNNPKCLLR